LREKALDVILAVLICLVWAGNYFVIKNVLVYVDPFTFALLRAFLGGAFIFAIGGYAVKGMTRRDLEWLVALGILNIGLFLILLNESLLTVNEGVDSTLIYTQPVLVAALSPLFGETLTRNRKIGIAAAFGGIIVIFLPSFIASTFVIGDVYALVASVCWAVAVWLFKRWKPTISINSVASLQSLIGGVVILPTLLLEKPFIDPTLDFWVYLAYNVILASGIAILMYWRILEHMSAAQFTSYFFLVPVFATIMGSIFQLSVPPVNELAGTALVALGIVAVNR
jgi:drug/metabolite transporter (DMT)-like permease